MKIMHLADVHLGAAYSGFGDLAPERRRDVLDAFRRLPDLATAERVHAVVLAGDLFDGPDAGTEALAAVRETLRRLVIDACIPVFMVPGNHDAVTLKLNPYREVARTARVIVQDGDRGESRSWPVPDERGQRLAAKHSAYILARPRFEEPVTVQTEAGPLHVYGVAYDGAECRDPIETFRRHPADGVHVAVLHAAVHDASHWRATGNSLATTADRLRRLEVDYVALGDQHRHRPPEELGGGRACYPGSFAATDLTETGPRGYVLVDIRPGQPPRVEHRDAGVRQATSAEVDVSPFEDDVQVAEAAAALLAPRAVPTVRLIGEPAFPLDADAIAAELRERHGHAAVIDETRYYASGRLDELSEQDTVDGHVVRLGRDRIDAAGSDAEREVARRALRVALRALEVD